LSEGVELVVWRSGGPRDTLLCSFLWFVLLHHSIALNAWLLLHQSIALNAWLSLLLFSQAIPECTACHPRRGSGS